MRAQLRVATTALSLVSAVALGWPRLAPAQDNVTIPRSRLEELERKEKELQHLKGEAAPAKREAAPAREETPRPSSPAAQPAQALAPVQAPPPEPPPVRYSSPALASLPPLQPGDVVESMDLANYYFSDHAAADQRFLKRKFSVRGQIVGFEKPLLRRNYRIFLKTPEREGKVMCDLLPPDKAGAVFTAEHGDTLVALMGETRVPLARVGQQVVVKGECKGQRDSVVTILGWDLQQLP